MAAELTDLLPPGLGIPDARGLVLRRSDDALAIGAERRAPNPIEMATEGRAYGMTGRGVPNPSSLVRGRGDDAFAIGAERRVHHIEPDGL